MPTHSQVLGITETAAVDEIRHAYRRLAKSGHPDVGGDPERFRLITRAYVVLSDSTQRTAYDLAIRPARRRRRYGCVAVVAAVLALAGAAGLVAATADLSVGDDCLVGSWRGDAFEVGFTALLDGRQVTAPIRGGAGVVLTVAADGKARAGYASAEPLAGDTAAVRIEGAYAGSTVERWQADDGRVRLTGTDTSRLTFSATINGPGPGPARGRDRARPEVPLLVHAGHAGRRPVPLHPGVGRPMARRRLRRAWSRLWAPFPALNAQCPICQGPVAVGSNASLGGRSPMMMPWTPEELSAACAVHGRPPANAATVRALEERAGEGDG